VGGLISGALLAFVIPYKKPGSSTPEIFKVLQIILVVVVLLSFYEVVTHYDGPAISFQNLSRIVE
jgi:hypothetical protein